MNLKGKIHPPVQSHRDKTKYREVFPTLLKVSKLQHDY